MHLWKRLLAVVLLELSCGREDVDPQNLLSVSQVTIDPHETDYDAQSALWKACLHADTVGQSLYHSLHLAVRP